MSKIISSEILPFLNKLKNNNNREWFQENKLIFQEISKSLEEFVHELIFEISKFDSSLKNTPARVPCCQ